MEFLEVAIYLESDEFGSEEFSYDSIDEATEGVRRLLVSCLKHYQEDGIERTLRVEIRSQEEE